MTRLELSGTPYYLASEGIIESAKQHFLVTPQQPRFVALDTGIKLRAED